MLKVAEEKTTRNEDRDPEEVAAEREAYALLWDHAEEAYDSKPIDRVERLEALESGLRFAELGLGLRLREAEEIAAAEVVIRIGAMLILAKEAIALIGEEVPR